MVRLFNQNSPFLKVFLRKMIINIRQIFTLIGHGNYKAMPNELLARSDIS